MIVYAYVRVSSEKQNCANQRHEIQTFCFHHHLKINRWTEEVISSRKRLEERRLYPLLQRLQKDDILITTEISRLGRNLMEIMHILSLCLNKECQVITLKENYHLGADIQSKVLAFAFGLASEIERQLISQRTKECLDRLKAEGRHLGRPFGLTYSKLAPHHDEIQRLLQHHISKKQIAQHLNCSLATLHRFSKKISV